MMNVEDLSNDELREQLLNLGVTVGPIGGTTRVVYVNKLKRLLEEKYGSGDAHIRDDASSGEGEQFVRVRATNPEISEFENENLITGTNSLPVNEPVSEITDTAIGNASPRRAFLEEVHGPVQDQEARERGHSSSSDSDLCGEESSRILTPNEIQKLNSIAPSLKWTSDIRTASYTGVSTNKYVAKEPKLQTPKYTAKRIFTVAVIVVMVIFLFFVIQNLLEVRNGERNYEEL
uniref:LEM domain-containing protein n=1 Tax=Parascaris univalens TaxID=6257 RepID=A0A915BVL9_PARUN